MFITHFIYENKMTNEINTPKLKFLNDLLMITANLAANCIASSFAFAINSFPELLITITNENLDKLNSKLISNLTWLFHVLSFSLDRRDGLDTEPYFGYLVKVGKKIMTLTKHDSELTVNFLSLVANVFLVCDR